jgi:cobalt-zinc-cadmium efflux system membrane fusion protein
MKNRYFIKTSSLGVFLVLIITSLSFNSALASSSAENGHEKHDEKENNHIELTEEQIKFSGIGLAKVGASSIRETLPVYGQIVANTEKMQAVTARFDGLITLVTKRIGDRVLKGEVLAKVESNDSLNSYSIKASIAGVITERNANVGEQTGGRTLFKITDFSNVWADLSVFPSDLKKLHIGQKVEIKDNAAGVTGEGKIIYITPFGQSENQTTKARVLLDNPERRLVPGHFISADVVLSESTVPLAIRADAVQMVEEHPVVFVQKGEEFEPREVTLGRTDDKNIEVLNGLKAGETYVTKNSYILKSELGKGEAEHGH